MSGRHKWSGLKGRLSPEQRQRMVVKAAELRATLPPTTYAQVRWAAAEYNNGEHNYNEYYRVVYKPDFRGFLSERCSESDVRKLLRFLNQWRSRRPDRLASVLATSLPEVISNLGVLSGSALDTDDLDDSAFGYTTLAFNSLTSIQDVGPTTASKILGVLNPSLFVMWDGPIQKEYCNWQKRNGHAYSNFVKEMRNSALSIVADSRKRGIEDPAETISKEIKQNPPFTLAKFINDYVWLTVTRKHRYDPGPLATQEHHA